MAGSLTIPNTFSTQSGSVPVSQLDNNLTTIATYVNAREITLGTLAGRPAAGVAGRLYCATDTNGGTLYEDTGATWTQIAGGVSNTSVGVYQTRGLTGTPNASTPATSYDLAADAVQLRNPSDGTVVVRTNTGTLTNDLTLAGATANGRDQAGAFTASTFVHLYFIWNGTTLATLSSPNAPPTGPAALPATYTHWAYAAAVRFDANSHIVATRAKGAWMFLQASSTLLSDGRVTSAATINLTNFVPSNAISVQVQQQHHAGSSTVNLQVGTDLTSPSGSAVKPYYSTLFGGVTIYSAQNTIRYPQVGQNLYYVFNVDPGANLGLTMALEGWQLPNGGE